MHKFFNTAIIDLSSIFYRSYYANTELNSNNIDVGAIKTTLLTIQSTIKRHNVSKIIIVVDGKGGSKHKKKIFSEYKSQRSFGAKLNLYTGTEENQQLKSKENFLWQLKTLFYVLNCLPVSLVVKEGYEADELVAYICNNQLKDVDKIIISNDKDYHQLINDKCYIFNLDTKNVIHYEYLQEKWNTKNTDNLIIIRSIIGDVSDNIHGLYGYAINSLKKYFIELFDNEKPLYSIDDFIQYLELKKSILESIGNKERTSVEKTTIKKINHILSGHDKKHSEELCIDILKRNYELMQLKNIDISALDMVAVESMLNKKINCDMPGVKKILEENNIQLNNYYFNYWDSFYSNNTVFSNLF